MRAVWRSALQESPSKLCQTYRLPALLWLVYSLLLSLQSRLWPRFINNLPWDKQSSIEVVGERSSDDITGTLIQNLLSNKPESDFSGTNSFSSLQTQLKKPCQKQAYINSCIIYDLLLFSFVSPPGAHHQVVQALGTYTHSSPPASGSSLLGQSLPVLPFHALLTAELALRFSGRKCNTSQESLFSIQASLASWQPSSLVTKLWVIKSWRKIKRLLYGAQTVNALKTGRCWWKHLAVRLETYHSITKMTCSLTVCLFWLHHKLL